MNGRQERQGIKIREIGSLEIFRLLSACANIAIVVGARINSRQVCLWDLHLELGVERALVDVRSLVWQSQRQQNFLKD